MPTVKLVSFIFHATITGLAAAFVIVFFFPGLLGDFNRNNHHPTDTVPSDETITYAAAVERAAPAVVNLYSIKNVSENIPRFRDPNARHWFGNARSNPVSSTVSNLGSAVILSQNGYLLTNNHLITDGNQIQVMLQDGRASTAHVVGTDPETDLAVLRVGLPNLPTAGLNETEQLRVGDVVLAIGNPFGVGQTVTMGIVSATGRHRLGLSTYEDFIQTDAAINPGNSGGALIDANGRLVGINTAIFGRSGGSEGIGFAIPINLATKVMRAILKNGYVVRGWLGAEIQRISTQIGQRAKISDSGGVRIGFVMANSPASAAGLSPGDIITHMDGEPIPNPRDAINYIADIMPGNVVTLQVVRAGHDITLNAKVGERPRQNSQ